MEISGTARRVVSQDAASIFDGRKCGQSRSAGDSRDARAPAGIRLSAQLLTGARPISQYPGDVAAEMVACGEPGAVPGSLPWSAGRPAVTVEDSGIIQQRQLGNSSLRLSVIGLGTWAIGGGDWKFGWGDQDDREAVAAIVKAVEL